MWTAYPNYDGGAAVSEYAVQMVTPDNTCREVYKGRDLDCIVTEVSPGRTYLFQVRAFNRVGVSLPGDLPIYILHPFFLKKKIFCGPVCHNHRKTNWFKYLLLAKCTMLITKSNIFFTVCLFVGRRLVWPIWSGQWGRCTWPPEGSHSDLYVSILRPSLLGIPCQQWCYNHRVSPGIAAEDWSHRFYYGEKVSFSQVHI